MSIDKTTIYFTAQPADVPGGFVIDFRHAASGIVLDMVEAALVTGLPEGLTMRNHPGLPGRAAWLWSGGTILQASMAMRRAGFASSRAELANPRTVPEKPKPEAPKAGDGPIVQLAPGIVMDMSGMMPRGTPDEPLVASDLVFSMKEHKGTVFICFGTTDPDYPDERPEEIGPELVADALWADVGEVVEVSEASQWRFASRHDAAETKRSLEALGLSETDAIFMWYDPEDLSFGVSTERQPFLGSHPAYSIFILPKDENSPVYDDLRDNHLLKVPPYFRGNLMENTWELKPDADRDDVIADMIARGYTHDPEIDNELGG